MALGNKGLAGLIAGEGEGAVETRRPPKAGFLGSRDNRLAELAAGSMVTRVHESVDPATCRIWEGHNRDYAALNESVCSDLLDSLRAQGRQEVPAIVRRVKGDPVHQYEVVCGSRRHWSVSWLRTHDYPDFRFVVEPRELNDEEAFRIADLENRSRKDLSDHERATDYARAIERYYDGSQQRMVERLKVTKSWLSRYLELAKLPPEILACFESPHVIGISHAASLAPALNHPRSRQGLLREATTIAADQRTRLERGVAPMAPAQVVARLTQARPREGAATSSRSQSLHDESGKLVVKAISSPNGALVFSIPKTRVGDHKSILGAIERYLDEIRTRS